MSATAVPGVDIAGIAIDAANRLLFALTNANPDMLYVYDITGLPVLLNSWALPWQSPTDGYDAGGLAFDDDSGNLVAVNQYGYGYGLPTEREEFSFTLAGGPVEVATCTLANTVLAWGLAIIEDGDAAPGSFESYHLDLLPNFGPPMDVDEYGIPAVYPPYDLICDVTVDNDVQMFWSNAEEYKEILIYKDGDLIASLPGDATFYLAPSPGVGTHIYGVSGVIDDDESGKTRCNINIYSPGPEWVFDFNATDGGWTTGGYADWQWGSPTYIIDGNAWETNLGANYYNSSCGWLDSPAINLGAEGGWMTFDYYEYVEGNYDGWNTQISLDGGTTWSLIYPVDGYDQGVPYGTCDEGLGGDTWYGYGVAGTQEFDLTGYPNTTVRIRFLFESDSSVAHSGPVLDNVLHVRWNSSFGHGPVSVAQTST